MILELSADQLNEKKMPHLFMTPEIQPKYNLESESGSWTPLT